MKKEIRKLINASLIYAVTIVGIVFVSIIYIYIQNSHYSYATNICVASLINKISINWDAENADMSTDVFIEVKDNTKVLKRVRITGEKKGYVFDEGIPGSKYEILFKDMYKNIEYKYTRLFLDSESLPKIPTLRISTDNYIDPKYETISPPEGLAGLSITNNEYEKGEYEFCEQSVIQNAGKIKIKIRGNTSSANNLKKSYKIKTDRIVNFLGNNNLIGSKEWILLNSGNNLGTYAGLFIGELCGVKLQPNMNFVNLILNGDYKGVYVLIQPINQQTFKNEIAQGGYIFENDAYWWKPDVLFFKTKWQGKLFGYVLKYPVISDTNDNRYIWLKNRMQDVEDHLLSTDKIVTKEIDFNSFAANLLARDILGQIDGVGSNTYYYIRNKGDSVIHMGPLWDFDCVCGPVNKWSDLHNNEINQSKYLWKYPEFSEEYKYIWGTIKSDLIEKLSAYLNKLNLEELDKGTILESERWGKKNASFTEQTQGLISYLCNRIEWIDSKMGFIPGDAERTIVTNGCYKTLYEFDDKNRLIRESCCGASGELVVRSDDFYAYKELSYDSNGRVASEWFYGINGALAVSAFGYAGRLVEHEESGLCIKQSFFGANKEPISIAGGYSSVTYEYDDCSNVISEVHYDNDGKRTNGNLRYAELRKEYDKAGHVIKESYWDKDGLPCYINGGFHKIERSYDEAGNILTEIYLDSKDKEIFTNFGYTRIERSYDNNNITEEFYYAFDKLRITNQGYAGLRRKYDKNGYVIEESYYDDENNMTNNIYGFSTLRRIYDCFNRLAEERYYDNYGKLVKNYQGYSIMSRQYNRDSERIIKEEYYDDKKNPVKSRDGYAFLIREYDSFNNVEKESYFDEEGNRTICYMGYDSLQRAYDKYNRLIKESYYKEDMPAIRCDIGAASYMREYDERGNVKKESYFGIFEEPIECIRGYASVNREYNDLRLVIEESYYDIDGKECLSVEGYSKTEKGYDAIGNIVEIRYYKDGVLRQGDYAIIKRDYDEKYQLLRESYFDSLGNPYILTEGYASFSREYDKYGNVTKESYMDYDGSPVIRDTGYAIVKRKYNERGQNELESFYDIEEKPIAISEGYQKIEREYDHYGNVINEKYLDVDNEPFVRDAGFSEIVRIINDRNQLSSELYYIAGVPAKTVWGYSRLEKKYDSIGNLVEERYYSSDGDPINTGSGYSVLKRTYDVYRRVISEAYYTNNGDLTVNNAVGYATICWNYDNVCNVVEEYTLDENCNRCNRYAGYCSVRKTWNGRRQIKSESYYDDRGNAAVNKEGVHQILYYYDDNSGYPSQEIKKDIDGNIVL